MTSAEWTQSVARLCAVPRVPDEYDAASRYVAECVASELARRGVDIDTRIVYDWIWEGDWWSQMAERYTPDALADEYME